MSPVLLSTTGRLSDGRAWVLAIVAVGVAGVITRTTWPFLTVAPFVLMFLAVYVSVRWGTRSSGLLATAAAYAWALWLSPPDVV